MFTNINWLRFLPLLLLLPTVGCSYINEVGHSAGASFAFFADLANWSWAWLLPGPILGVLISSDGQEVRKRTFYSWNNYGDFLTTVTHEPTGQVVKGNPKLGVFFCRLWLTAYPVLYPYGLVWLKKGQLRATNFPNLDMLLFLVFFPILILSLIGWIIKIVAKSNSKFCKYVAKIWLITIATGYINLALWITVVLIKYLSSWLFAK